MDIAQLVDCLRKPQAIPFAVKSVEVRQTHISAVFLAGDWAYKIKKPVKLGFLDFSTLEKRKYSCEQEVHLNRRLAPRVYIDVVPIIRTAQGFHFEVLNPGDTGEIIDWAVKMRRLPDEATLEQYLLDGRAKSGHAQKLGQRLARFHAEARSNEKIAAFGRYELVQHNVMDVFQNSENHVGLTVDQEVFQKIKTMIKNQLFDHRGTIQCRSTQSNIRDCHGDLHLDHVYLFPEENEPDDLVIIDCIEFNEQFRYIDPVADMAFAFMDFHFLGRRDLAQIFQESYFLASGDQKGKDLLPLYTAYRATVRGMVDGVLLSEKEIPEGEKNRALSRGRAHWLLALAEIAPPGQTPCLILVGGLPGTGKSTLARELATTCNFVIVRSDVVRKELLGLPTNQPTPAEEKNRLYSPAKTEEVYSECRRRVSELLFRGHRVIVDATFREQHQRDSFLELAVTSGVEGVVLLCEADPETIQERLEKRAGDASDADWTVYQKIAQAWDPIRVKPGQIVRSISTDNGSGQAAREVIDLLKKTGLWDAQTE